jgi:hypothetical protein
MKSKRRENGRSELTENEERGGHTPAHGAGCVRAWARWVDVSMGERMWGRKRRCACKRAIS